MLIRSQRVSVGAFLLLFGSHFHLTQPVLGTPVIESVTGQIRHGRKLVVLGRFFGEKPNAAPLMWDSMETGSFNPAWKETHDLSISQNSQRHKKSIYNGRLNFNESNNDGRFKMGDAVYKDWFVQYWFQVAKNWNWGSTDYSGNNRFLSNIKVFRMWNPGTSAQNFVVAINAWEDCLEYVMEGIPNAPRGTALPSLKDRFSKGVWHLLQFQYSDSSIQGKRDGSFKMWFDGKEIISEENILTREDKAGYKRPFIIGFSEVWGPNKNMSETDRSPNDFYIDDVYADNSWARIEIGDQPEYNSCTHREIQPITQWSNAYIEFNANLGSFQEGAPVFLFVVDSRGAPNTSGYPLIVGEGTADEVVAKPKPKQQQRKATNYRDLKPAEEELVPAEGQVIKFNPEVFEVKVYDSVGGLVFSRTKKNQKEISWDGRGDDGQVLPPDTYLCKIRGIYGEVLYHTIVVR